jgi:hypothetical protein
MNIHIKQSKQFIQLMDLLIQLKILTIVRHKVSMSTILWGAKQPVIDPTWIPINTVSYYNEYIQIVSARNR